MEAEKKHKKIDIKDKWCTRNMRIEFRRNFLNCDVESDLKKNMLVRKTDSFRRANG